MFAILNWRKREYVYGTDFRYRPFRQRTSPDKMLTFATFEDAAADYAVRNCGADYVVVELEQIRVKRVVAPVFYRDGNIR